MSELKIEICHSLQITYDMYTTILLLSIWEVYGRIINKWIAENENIGQKIIEEEEKRTIEEQELLIQAEKIYNKYFNISEETQPKISDKPKRPKTLAPIIENFYIYNGLCKPQFYEAITPLSTLIQKVNTKQKIDPFRNEEVANLLSDLTYSKNKKLSEMAVSLLYLHFNQLDYLTSKFANITILPTKEDLTVFNTILNLKQKFEILTGYDKLMKDPTILEQISRILSNNSEDESNVQIQKLGLIQISHGKSMKNEEERNVLNTMTNKDIQGFLRQSQVHITILQFLHKQDLLMLGRIPAQNDIIINSLQFLYFFIKNNKINAKELMREKYIQLLCGIFDYPIFQEIAFKTLTELIILNHEANLILEESFIYNVITITFNTQDALTFCEYIKFLQFLVVGESGMIESRQHYVLSALTEVFNIFEWVHQRDYIWEENIEHDETEQDITTGHLDDQLPRKEINRAALSGEQLKHVEFIQLLALCATGKMTMTKKKYLKRISPQVKYLYISFRD